MNSSSTFKVIVGRVVGLLKSKEVPLGSILYTSTSSIEEEIWASSTFSSKVVSSECSFSDTSSEVPLVNIGLSSVSISLVLSVEVSSGNS